MSNATVISVGATVTANIITYYYDAARYAFYINN